LSRLVTDDLRASHPELAELVAPYRAGYTASQRRELESRLTRGELRAVITTDALELGIDIGALDAALVVTFPGTVASLRQMWGRAAQKAAFARRARRRGRRGRQLRPAPRRRLPGRRSVAALGLGADVFDRRRRHGRAARLHRGDPRALHCARRRHLHAPRALLRGPRARSR